MYTFETENNLENTGMNHSQNKISARFTKLLSDNENMISGILISYLRSTMQTQSLRKPQQRQCYSDQNILQNSTRKGNHKISIQNTPPFGRFFQNQMDYSFNKSSEGLADSKRSGGYFALKWNGLVFCRRNLD